MNRSEAEQMLGLLQRRRPERAKTSGDNLSDLNGRLEETVAWCKRHLDMQGVGRCLRPARLTPPPLAKDRWAATDAVVSARRAEFSRTSDVTLDDVSGRMLVYFPDIIHDDGPAAERASEDFFDIHAAPPWGTWVGMFEQDGTDPVRSCHLLAWVPWPFVRLAKAGIAAAPSGAIAWLRKTDLALRHIAPFLRIGDD